VGALRLAELCKELEANWERESRDWLEQRIASIDEEYGSVRNELSAELGRGSK
jgi:hypothetical protein